MSTGAYWRPVVYRSGNGIDDVIKCLIAKRYMDHDGSLTGLRGLNGEDIEWLQGLHDAGIKDAMVLIEAIRKHHDIEVWIE